MAKTKKAQSRNKTSDDRFALIHTALRKLKKDDLVDLLLTLSKRHGVVYRELESTLQVEKPNKLLVSDVKKAIKRATDFDKRMLNRNFPVDWQAYKEVDQGLQKLVQNGLMDEAKLLALELMKQGSYQVECSDECMMSEDLERCLNHVIKAMSQLVGDAAEQWATQMIAADRSGNICSTELEKLQGNKKR